MHFKEAKIKSENVMGIKCTVAQLIKKATILLITLGGGGGGERTKLCSFTTSTNGKPQKQTNNTIFKVC